MTLDSVFGAHHDGSERYLSDPNPELGETVAAFVRVPLAAGVDTVEVRALRDGGQYHVPARIDRTTATEAWWRVDIEVHNPLTPYRFQLHDRDGRAVWLNGAGVHGWDVTDQADFVLSAHHEPPSWVHRTVWYQVFPDRFAPPPGGDPHGPAPSWARPAGWTDPVATAQPESMTQLYGGTLDGVTASLDHLADLGATGLYLCPFFPGRSNHRYDASSFDHVDPLLGGDDALRELVAAARRRGIRVMGDLTTNHSGDHHDWFTTAVADERAATREFYSWRPDGSYDSYMGIPTMPAFDHSSPALRRALYEGADSVAGRFLGEEFGLAAMRIDVASMTGRQGVRDLNRTCAEGLRETMRAVRPDAWLLAEYSGDPSADLDGGGWHGSMNYGGFSRPAWAWLARDDAGLQAPGEPSVLTRRSGSEVARSAQAYLARIPYSVALTNMNLLGSHDTARWAHATGSTARNAVGVAMLCTWPGSPSVIYGDEIGLGDRASWDVEARIPFPWHDRASWHTELLGVYRELIALRSASSALAVGGLRWVSVGDDHLVYLRESRDERLLVHLARADHPPVAVSLADLAATDVDLRAGAPASVRDGTVELDASGPTWRVLELAGDPRR